MIFDRSCDIRSNFLSALEELLHSKAANKNKINFISKLELPKKAGIFQHIPLYNLYKNKFVLAKKRKIKKADIEDKIIEESKSFYLVFVNGHIDLSLSDISSCEGQIAIEEKSLSLNGSKILEKEYNFFMSLNKELSREEVHITIKENAVLRSPLQILSVITEDVDDYSLFTPRIFVNLKENSTSNLYFSGLNLSSSKYFWMNQALHLNIDKNATCKYYCYYPCFNKSYFFNLLRAKQKKQSILKMFLAMSGGVIEHTDIKVSLDEEFAMCNLTGLFLLKGGAQSHINVNIDHNAENTKSNQLVKGILKDETRSSFEATVYIDKKAQKTESCQLNKNLILSEKAQAFSKPFLKVFADDVKATHGATIYRLQEEDLFYLTSRGISEAKASYLLIKGFCQEIINPVNIQTVKSILEDKIIHYLG